MMFLLVSFLGEPTICNFGHLSTHYIGYPLNTVEVIAASVISSYSRFSTVRKLIKFGLDKYRFV